jgi:hypothetical protein
LYSFEIKIFQQKLLRMKIFYSLFIVITFFANTTVAQTPPYSGTIFIDPDIITPADPSTVQSTTYAGTGMRTVYDRRVPPNGAFITINAYLFNIVWSDGLTCEAIILLLRQIQKQLNMHFRLDNYRTFYG